MFGFIWCQGGHFSEYSERFDGWPHGHIPTAQALPAAADPDGFARDVRVGL